MAGDNENFWQDIELRVYPELFYTSYQISTINKKSRPKTPLNSKTPFKWLLMDIIPSTSSRSWKKDTTFSNLVLIVDDDSKLPKL